MAEILNVNPTRMELGKLKKRLATARRGHKLLKDKCDELMKTFLECVRENKELRRKVEVSLADVHASFTVASALTSEKVLEESLIYPKTETELSVSTRNIMSVNVPEYEFHRTEQADGLSNYGFAFTTGELDEAVEALDALTPQLLKLAEAEKRSQMLAEEIEKTRRRVNALEYTMIPQLEATIRVITMKLGENERGNLTRLMKVKDMMVKQTLENAKPPNKAAFAPVVSAVRKRRILHEKRTYGTLSAHRNQSVYDVVCGRHQAKQRDHHRRRHGSRYAALKKICR